LDAVWTPSREWIERTNVWRFMQRLGFSDRKEFLRFSVDQPERFWAELMREMNVGWFEPYRRVMDASRGPEWAQWFIGGRLKIAHNCLDRWAGSGRMACLWEDESGATRSITFGELLNEANRVANGLTALGLQPGDRVALCMPMLPEILSILYGCLKAGLTVVPIFAGFGAGAIGARLEDSGAKVVFTAESLTRRHAIPAHPPFDRRALGREILAYVLQPRGWCSLPDHQHFRRYRNSRLLSLAASHSGTQALYRRGSGARHGDGSGGRERPARSRAHG